MEEKVKCCKSLRKIAALIFFIILFSTTGFERITTSELPTGEELFKLNCLRCHGADGTKGFLGAKNLKKSFISDSAAVKRIQNGKGFMPSFRNKLTPDELNQVLLYIKGLREK